MFDYTQLVWTPRPLPYKMENGRIEITTQPETDLWKETMNHSSCVNAPVLQMKTSAPNFAFTVKAAWQSSRLYDQCGLVMYLNENTWLKASVEREDDEISHLGSVATNHVFSDWACADVDASVCEMWYRLTRNGSDFTVEYSKDGKKFSMLRMCHMWECEGDVSFGLYACSPRDSSFMAVFTELDFQVIAASERAD